MNRIATLAFVVWLEMIRRKDLYVLLILLGVLLFVLLSLNVFGLGGVVRYATDVGLLFAWLFSIILTVSAAARQLPQEESKRTIYPLLARPVTRGEVLLGKWLGAWTAAVAATFVFYALVVGVVFLRGGTMHPVTLAQGFILHMAALAVLGAAAMLFSTRMNFDAAAACTYILVAACFILAPRVPEMLVYQSGAAGAVLFALYYALPHLELFDLRMRMVHDWGPIPLSVWLTVLAYGLVWSALLLAAAWLAYRRKPLRRGAAL